MEIDNKICERCGHKLLVGAIEENLKNKKQTINI